MHVLGLPLEIHEKILSYLEIRDLMSAIQTCQMWQTIGNLRHVKKWCLQHISSEVISELTCDANAVDGKDIDWGKLCRKWSKSVDTSTNDNVQPTAVAIKCTCAAISGDLVIVSDVLENLTWYDFRGGEIAKKQFDEPIASIGLLSLTNHYDLFKMDPLAPDSLYLQHDAVIVLGSSFLGIYCMPTWQCRDLFFLQDRHIEASVSVHGKRFTYYNGALKLIRVCAITVLGSAPWPSSPATEMADFKLEIKVDPVCNIYTTAPIQNWKLWKDSVICLQNNGTVLIANANTGEKSYQSNVISEMLYPFESFLYRHLIFCNVNVARAMLNFWHINVGLPHWLVSTNGITFKRMSTYLEPGEEIKSIAIQRSVIVAGTSRGRICIYRHTGPDEDIPKTILEGPMATYHIGQDQFYKCDMSLDGHHFLIVVKTRQDLIYVLKLPVIENYTLQKAKTLIPLSPAIF